MIFNMGSTPDLASMMPTFTYTGTYELIDDGKVSNKQNWRLKLKTSGVLTFQRIGTAVDIFGVGGGGGGCLSGGGGGYTETVSNKTLTMGQSYTVTIGAGGGVGNTSGARGGTSSFGSLLSAEGGYGATTGGSGRGGNGGSGGGDWGGVARAGSGGSNGSNGYANWIEVQDSLGQWVWAEDTPAGQGQGTTTSEFAEGGTVYAGGGAGGSAPSNWKNINGYGGDGGGGHGACRGAGGTAVATAGGTNTGGGGGGGNIDGYSSMAGGSGIIVIRNHR